MKRLAFFYMISFRFGDHCLVMSSSFSEMVDKIYELFDSLDVSLDEFEEMKIKLQEIKDNVEVLPFDVLECAEPSWYIELEDTTWLTIFPKIIDCDCLMEIE